MSKLLSNQSQVAGDLRHQGNHIMSLSFFWLCIYIYICIDRMHYIRYRRSRAIVQPHQPNLKSDQYENVYNSASVQQIK